MRLLFFIPVWKRPEITEICFMGIDRLRKHPEHDINVLAVISEVEMIPLCEKYEVEWCMTANSPLGAKKNFGLREAMKKDFDYLVEIGSDDLLRNEILDLYTWTNTIYGLCDFVLIDTERGKAKLLGGKISKFGAGRAIRKDIITGDLWNDLANKGMDNYSHFKLAREGYFQKAVRPEFPLAVALKSDVNLWGYRKLTGKIYPIEKAFEGLSEQEINAIKCLATKNKSADLIGV